MIFKVPLRRLCALAMFPVICMADTSFDSDSVLLVVEVPKKMDGSSTQIQFTLADLSKMPMVDFETETIWFTGSQKFAGVPLEALMQEIGVTEGTLIVSAADGHSIDFDLSLAKEFGSIIAYKRNGELLTVRKKGPLRLVYDYERFPPLVRDKLYSHSIWQITRIEVEPEGSKLGLLR